MISQLRSMALRGLKRMYRPEERFFIFRVKRSGNGVISEGLSRRYTAISLIGLAGEDNTKVVSILAGQNPHDVCERLRKDINQVTNLGDVALSLWASCASGFQDSKEFRERLLRLKPDEKQYSVVELSWALDACCIEPEGTLNDLGKRLAGRLISSFNTGSGLFPHLLGSNKKDPRSHVSCFADAVYPIHALSNYFKITRDREALYTAVQCAETICKLQGQAGQWWWHYDYRTGNVIEPYPVYSVHQDAMAPMAMFAVSEAGGPDFTKEIKKGLDWLSYSPEINASLIDKESDLIWRKVARREPGKLARYAQAIASRAHPAFRVPGLNTLFPPNVVDYENRPYHLGWLLYAWPEERAEKWDIACRE